jgi:uncharacterized phage-associated protein
MPERLTCQDVADYLLSISGDSFNFKLQKLLYYTQGYHLALFGKPLFDEPIEAQQNGPCVPVLFDVYKVYGPNPISKPEKIDLSKYSEGIKALLGSIIGEYGQYSAGQLREMVWAEMPWINGFKRESKIISYADLKQYFLTKIENNKK